MRSAYVDGSPSTAGGITYQDGYKLGSYSGFGLSAANGPQSQVDYHVASRGGEIGTSYNYDAQQATPAYFEGDYSTPTVFQTSDIATGFGINRAAIQLTGTVEAPFTISDANAIHPGYSGTVTQRVLGSAQSIWRDTVTFSTSGAVIFNVAINGTTDASSWWLHGLSAIDSAGVSQSIASDFADRGNPGSTSRTLTGTLSVVAGEHYVLGGAFYAYVQDGAGLTNFYDTAKVTAIRLAAGNTATFASNSADWDAIVTTVPEPEVTAMLLAGLGILGFTARRRRNA